MRGERPTPSCPDLPPPPHTATVEARRASSVPLRGNMTIVARGNFDGGAASSCRERIFEECAAMRQALIAMAATAVLVVPSVALASPSRVDPGETVLLASPTKVEGCTLEPKPRSSLLDRGVLQEAHQARDLLVHVPYRRLPQRACLEEARSRRGVRAGAESLRIDARDRPHRVARARRIQRHREPLSGASCSRPRVSRQGQAREQSASARVRREP